MSRPSTFFRGLIGALALGALLSSCGGSAPQKAAAASPVPRLYGLTEAGELVTLSLGKAATEPVVHALTGLDGETLVDLDVRPGDGELYGISARGVVYHLFPATGAAVPDGAVSGRSTVAMDFDPAGGRLRVLSAAGELGRLTLQTPPLLVSQLPSLTDDGPVTYSGASALPAQLSALAHSESYDVHSSGAYPPRAPTLYSIDVVQDTLVAHVGGPQFGGLKTVAVLGQDAQLGRTGFDIAGPDLAYVSLSDGHDTALYVTALTPPPAGTGKLLQSVKTFEGLSLRSIALSLPVR